jgi:hypothetical protein
MDLILCCFQWLWSVRNPVHGVQFADKGACPKGYSDGVVLSDLEDAI